MHSRKRFGFIAAAIPSVLMAGALAADPAFAAAGTSHDGGAAVTQQPGDATIPLPNHECQAVAHTICYTPAQLSKAYNLDPLYKAGITGKGQTIVIMTAFGSPTLQHDLDVYSKQFGLKTTKVDVISFRRQPVFDPDNNSQINWAIGITGEVELAHTAAPDARIVLAETGVDVAQTVTGWRQVMDAEKYLIDHNIGDVIVNGFNTTENNFPGFDKGDFSSIEDLRYAFKDAEKHHVTLIGASGQRGTTSLEPDGSTPYPFQVNSWPSSDPLVTSVGGTSLHLTDTGERTAPDSVFNDNDIHLGASGGGLSHVFARPSYQDGVKNVVGNHRSTPDISMNAAGRGGFWTYGSAVPVFSGWRELNGTEQGAPYFAGIVALAGQMAHHRLGNINETVYKLAAASRHDARTGIIDVNDGTNNNVVNVPGFTAVDGYEPAAGVGTFNAALFVPRLAQGH
ncbi:protease [Actinoplanes sp. TBRC 11911]|nr:protease [Actinoplanes sp. TBRC 11911]